MNFGFKKFRKLQFKISDKSMNQTVRVLDKITNEMTNAGGAAMFNAVEDLRRKLKNANPAGMLMKFNEWEQLTNVPRREWTLLTLYDLSLNEPNRKEWLRDFDHKVARSILGNNSKNWKRFRRKQVTLFFFSKFDSIKCLELLSEFLRESWKVKNVKDNGESAKVWHEHSNVLFDSSGPSKIAKEWKYEVGESVEELNERFHIPNGSEFSERVRIATYFLRLKELELFEDDPELFSILEKEKSFITKAGKRVGSLAVEMIVNRVIKEANSRWSNDESWAKRIIPLSSDPRIRKSENFGKWWSWASDTQLQVASQALTKLNISEFINLLRKSLPSDQQDQFKERQEFLWDLIDNNYVLEARLVLRPNLRVTKDISKSLKPSTVESGDRSYICLRCVDNVFLIEGTHSFGLRGFIGEKNFPIKKFWENLPKKYKNTELIYPRDQCPVYQVHNGNWVRKFLNQMRAKNKYWESAHFRNYEQVRWYYH